ncbi:MAG: transposase [Deltaproteobacteria bacterium]|jgi:hypothetical protein|nr:transposase [Deltaproteobacteria bacterium]
MTETITCPGCGSAIEPDPSGEELVCPKCNTSIPNPEGEGQEPDAAASAALAADRVAEEALPRLSGLTADSEEAIDAASAQKAPIIADRAKGSVSAQETSRAADRAQGTVPAPTAPLEDYGTAGGDSQDWSPHEADKADAADKTDAASESTTSDGARKAPEPASSPEAAPVDRKAGDTASEPEPSGDTDRATETAANCPGSLLPTDGDGIGQPTLHPADAQSGGPADEPATTAPDDEPAAAAPDDWPDAAESEALAEDAAFAWRGRRAMRSSDLASAEECFRKAAELNPDSYEAWKGLAECILHRPAGGVFKGIRMIDFLKADIEPEFVESALPADERGRLGYLRHEASGAILACGAPSAETPAGEIAAVILGPTVHRYAGFTLPGAELAAGGGRKALREWQAFRDSFAVSLDPLRTRLVNAARLAPKGKEAELVMEYAFRFLDRPLAMADTCAGGTHRTPDRRCFIASAVYGDPDAPEVLTFRRFRDELLLGSPAGRAVVRLYYAFSPPLASRIAKSPALTRFTRRALDAIASFLDA